MTLLLTYLALVCLILLFFRGANRREARREKQHHRVSEEGKALGRCTSRMAEVGRMYLESEGILISEVRTSRAEMCASCACRPGTVPNGCAQTQLDMIKAVAEQKPFLCQSPKDGRFCAGCIYVMVANKIIPMPDGLIEAVGKYDFSPPDPTPNIS